MGRAGALGTGVSPIHGIPAGCPLANGLLHVGQPQGTPDGWLTPFATFARIRLEAIPEEAGTWENNCTGHTQELPDENTDRWESGGTQLPNPVGHQPGTETSTEQTQPQ
eukprot:9763348-Heterocapsa_arctica.AAC.1